jgi:two-component system, cell cycle sensor histidine kinase PleC
MAKKKKPDTKEEIQSPKEVPAASGKDEALEYAESIINTIREPLIALDQDLRVVSVSRSFYDFFKVKPEDTVGQLIYDLGNKQWDIPKLRELLETILPQKASFDNYEVEHDFTTVGKRIMLLNARQIQRGSEKERIILLAIEDITERKQIEAELADYRDHLEKLVTGRTEELACLNAVLARQNKELEQIVYVASHDLRSPLVNVQGFSKELGYALEELGGILKGEGVPPDIREKATRIFEREVPDSLKFIMTSISRMDMLLSGLLKLSRLGRAALKIEKLNMNNTVSEIINTFEFQLKETGTTMEVGGLPPCRGDDTQIGQVFSNLIGNALKYLDPARPGKIIITGEQREGHVVYRVEDNGIGITPEHKEIVFELFHRLNPGASEGEGLGLTIVRTILDRHNGKIQLESEPGKGSSVFVSLPCA